MTKRANSGRHRPVLPLLAVSIAAAAGGAVLVLATRQRLAAAPIAVAGICLAPAGRWARLSRVPRLVFADSAVERAVDALLLGSVAWVALPEAPRLAAAALVALVAGYLASYVRARAVGLGFHLQESVVDRSVHLGALALGLATGYLEVALWAAAAWSLAAAAHRAVEVARQKEPA